MFVLRIIRWVAWALVAVAIFVGTGIAVGWFRTEWLGQSPPVAVTTTGAPAVGGPFSLVNHRGERVSQDTFKGKPTAYFFGFTHCPEVCPTTLFEMTQHLKELGPDADRLNVVFVTVDPERDTPELLRTYLESFDPASSRSLARGRRSLRRRRPSMSPTARCRPRAATTRWITRHR